MNLVFIYLGEECLVITYSASCATMCLLHVISGPELLDTDVNKYDDFFFWIIYDGDETMFDQLLNSEFFPGIFLFFQMPIFVFDYILF